MFRLLIERILGPIIDVIATRFSAEMRKLIPDIAAAVTKEIVGEGDDLVESITRGVVKELGSGAQSVAKSFWPFAR